MRLSPISRTFLLLILHRYSGESLSKLGLCIGPIALQDPVLRTMGNDKRARETRVFPRAFDAVD